MIALPIANSKKNSNLSPLFGKAKYFAFFDGKTIELLENKIQNGKQIAAWLKEKGVDRLIVKHLGQKPFENLLNLGIEIYFCDEKIASNEAVLKLLNNELVLVDSENYDSLLGEEEKNTFSTTPKKKCHSHKHSFVSMKEHSHCH